MDNIIVKFEAEVVNYDAATAAMGEATEADRQAMEQAKKTQAAVAEKNKAITDSSNTTKKSIVDLGNAMNNVDKAVVGVAYKKTLQEIDQQTKATVKTIVDNFKKSNLTLADFKDMLNSSSATGKAFSAGLREALDEAGVSWEEFEAAVNASGKSISDLLAKQDELKKRLKDNRDTASPFEKLNKDLTDTNRKIFDTVAAMEKLKRSGGGDTEGYANLAKQLADAKAQADKLNAQLNGVKDTALNLINAGRDGFDELGNKIEEPVVKTERFTTQLRAMRQELLALEDSGSDFSQKYQMSFEELSVAAAKLEDDIGDMSTRIRAMASDSFAFDAMIEGVTGVAGAFSIAQGAAALFGDENKDLQQVLVKVNGAMAVLQGLQTLNKIILDQSIAKTGVEVAMRKLNALSINLESVAESKNIVVRYAAIAAQKVLNAVMSASPAGILFTAIAAVAGALLYFTSNSGDAEEQTKKLNQALESQNDLLNLDLDGIKRRSAIIEAQIKNNGAAALAGAKNEKEAAKIKEDTDKQLVAAKRKQLADELTALEQHKKDVIALQYEEGANQLDIDKKLADADKQIADKNAEIKINDLDANQKLNETKYEKNKDAAEKQKKLAQDSAQALFEIAERHLKNEADLYDEFSKSGSLGFNTQLSSLQTYIEKRTQLLNLQRNNDLSKEGLNADQKRNINDKYNLELENLTQDGYNRRNQIIRERNAALLNNTKQFAEDQAAAEKQRIEEVVSDIDTIYAKVKKNNSNEQVSLLGDLEDQYKNGLISIDEFEKRRQTLNQEYARRDINNQISSLETKISNLKSQGLATEDLETKLTEAKKQKYDQDAQNFQSAEQRKTQTAQQEEQRRQEIMDAAFQLGSNIVSGYFGYINEMYQNEYAQVSDLQSKKIITEEEAARRMADIKRRQAQSDKEGALFQIAIQTAQNIVKYLGNPIMEALVIAAGLTQAAFVAAKPIPKYKTGKIKIDGPGTETSDSIPAMLSRNESVINAAATRRYQPALEAINSMRFEEYLAGLDVPHLRNYDIKLPSVANVKANSMHIDYDRLGESIGRYITEMQGKISDIPGVDIAIDETGIHAIVKKENSVTEFQNKRYSTK